MKTARIFKIVIVLALIGVAIYFGSYYYHFAKGVKEDSERRKTLQIPEQVKLNDSTTMIIHTIDTLQ